MSDDKKLVAYRIYLHLVNWFRDTYGVRGKTKMMPIVFENFLNLRKRREDTFFKTEHFQLEMPVSLHERIKNTYKSLGYYSIGQFINAAMMEHIYSEQRKAEISRGNIQKFYGVSANSENVVECKAREIETGGKISFDELSALAKKLENNLVESIYVSFSYPERIFRKNDMNGTLKMDLFNNETKRLKLNASYIEYKTLAFISKQFEIGNVSNYDELIGLENNIEIDNIWLNKDDEENSLSSKDNKENSFYVTTMPEKYTLFYSWIYLIFTNNEIYKNRGVSFSTDDIFLHNLLKCFIINDILFGNINVWNIYNKELLLSKFNNDCTQKILYEAKKNSMNDINRKAVSYYNKLKK